MTAVSILVNKARRPLVTSSGAWANAGGVIVIPTIYHNGYSNRQVGTVSRLLFSGSHPNSFPALLRRTHPDLKTVGNGGLVQTGFDFQVESLDRVVYPYHIHSYSPTTGKLELIVSLPLDANVENPIALYYNNPDVLSSQENKLASWNNKALTVYHLPSLLDFSGNGRNLGDTPIAPTEYIYTLVLTSNRTVPNTVGADLWGMTWAADGNVYATFGDGPNTNSVSLGLAKVTGSAVSNIAVVFLVGGPSPVEADHWAPITGFAGTTELDAKCTNLLAYGTNLYLGLADNPNRGWDNWRLAKVSLSNIAAGPTVPSWGMGQDHTWKTINPAFLQCGKNLEDGFDDYVYLFPQHYAPVVNPDDSPSHNPAQFYLIRCLKTNDWQTQANWEWWTGGTDDSPTWGSYASRVARITMTGQCDWRPSAHYIKAPIDRCIFRVGRTGNNTYGGGSQSKFGTFIAQRPWHSWTLIDNTQYFASSVAADLAQVSAKPDTITINTDGSVEWVDSVWGGEGPDGLGGSTIYNSDKFIATRSVLTPVSP